MGTLPAAREWFLRVNGMALAGDMQEGDDQVHCLGMNAQLGFRQEGCEQ